jgi:hypothetical protein
LLADLADSWGVVVLVDDLADPAKSFLIRPPQSIAVDLLEIPLPGVVDTTDGSLDLLKTGDTFREEGEESLPQQGQLLGYVEGVLFRF